MKKYTFFIVTFALTITVNAKNKQSAILDIAHQLNIAPTDGIICLGINLGVI